MKEKSDDEIFEWIKENKKHEIGLAKCRIIHAYHNYCKRLHEEWDKYTKGMSKLDKSILIEELQSGFNDNAWIEVCDDVMSEIAKNYDLTIEHEDLEVHINKMTSNFVIDVRESIIDYDKKKMSNLNYEIELDGDAYFMVNLIKYMNT